MIDAEFHPSNVHQRIATLGMRIKLHHPLTRCLVIERCRMRTAMHQLT